MNNFTKELVDKFANDLLIELTGEENKMVLDEFDIIKENMEKINELEDIKNIEPMTHPLEFDDVLLRSDEVSDELFTEEVLQNTTHKTIDSIVVPKVVEE